MDFGSVLRKFVYRLSYSGFRCKLIYFWSYIVELVLFWAGGIMYEVLIVSCSYVHTSLVLLSNVYVCPAEYIIILIGSVGGGMLTLGGKLLILMSTLFS